MKEYSKVIFETEEKDYFCIWYSDINSGFIKDNDHIACFREPEVLDGYCNAKGYTLGKDTMIFDLTSLMEFASKKTDDADPSALLNFWNICSDIAFTLKISFVGDDETETLSELYDTLFFMESSEDAEDKKTSKLTKDDLEDLREVITEGCKLVVTNLCAL